MNLTLRGIVILNVIITTSILGAYHAWTAGHEAPVVKVVKLSAKNKEALERQKALVQKYGFAWLSYRKLKDKDALDKAQAKLDKMRKKAADAIAARAAELINTGKADVVVGEDAVLASKNRFIVNIN